MATKAHQRDGLPRLRIAKRRCDAIRSNNAAIGLAFALGTIFCIHLPVGTTSARPLRVVFDAKLGTPRQLLLRWRLLLRLLVLVLVLVLLVLLLLVLLLLRLLRLQQPPMTLVVVMLRGRWRHHHSTPRGQHQRAAEAPNGQSGT